MNKINDIRPYKNKLREQFKAKRTELSAEEKDRLDKKITNKILNMWQYRDEEIMLVYVSTPIEVDTKQFISKALSDGKTVAVPRCVNGTRNMNFYIIKSLDDLEPGAFNVLEPIIEKCTKLENLNKGLCIVPALSFDKKGFRLGYGKGYYDRFLSNFSGETLGLCYNFCMMDDLPHGKYDRRVDKIITDSNIIIPKKEKGGIKYERYELEQR